MKIFKYLLFLAILFSFACKKERIQNPIPEPFCLNSSPSMGVSPIDVNGSVANCNTQFPIDTSRWCEIIPKETLLLEEEAKCWVPQYQFDIGQSFTYNNAAGQSITLTLTDKAHLLGNRIYTSERCETNANKRKGHCYESELFYITLKDATNKIEYYIEMRATKIQFADTTEINTPELLIMAVLSNNARGALLWDKEFDKTETLYQLTEFSEEITLLNRTFENVICNGRPVVNKAYYNKEFGLLGFEDDEEVLWVLQ